MKVFAFVVNNINPKDNMCFNDRQANIYEIKNNTPKMIAWASYFQTDKEDDETKVLKALVHGGFISKNSTKYKIIRMN